MHSHSYEGRVRFRECPLIGFVAIRVLAISCWAITISWSISTYLLHNSFKNDCTHDIRPDWSLLTRYLNGDNIDVQNKTLPKAYNHTKTNTSPNYFIYLINAIYFHYIPKTHHSFPSTIFGNCI